MKENDWDSDLSGLAHPTSSMAAIHNKKSQLAFINYSPQNS
jgi:hypothetical protein